MGIENSDCVNLVFTYGTLKRGFSNHVLLQDLMRTGDAVFKGSYRTLEKYPLVCGPYRVPFLLNMSGSGQFVMGELYAVSARGLARVDELEGTSRGHYERRPIRLTPAGNKEKGGEELLGCSGELTCATEAYYAHESYEEEMWNKNGRKGFEMYSKKEAEGYVKRKDRPQNLSFLDHIRIFVSSPSD
ncbi:putative gamma-glutamylcyclotransferase [Hibiscus syriacus]|uniref:Gamma-glutamylcyclotransferase family protein n=1 Tax=Hibiscus syriacus TaxID=106335 RepID=A0A6A3A6F0_HIBSY|nr:putative gamma-glutamylcyclotransferase At3g02910 [Hibiscus syriacus]KAE8699277.1 putative gamma-glutamylcyclotransferase [Hibiscus syriacus]